MFKLFEHIGGWAKIAETQNVEFFIATMLKHS